MFSEKELSTQDFETLMRKALKEVSRMIWDVHRDSDDVLHHIQDLFHASCRYSSSSSCYSGCDWQPRLIDDLGALGVSCTIENETDSLRSHIQKIWTVHLPHFDFWVTERRENHRKENMLSFSPPSTSSFYGMNDWPMHSATAQRLALIDNNYDHIRRVLDEEILRASKMKQMTEILETTWSTSINAETGRLFNGIHRGYNHFSCAVRYLEDHFRLRIGISDSWRGTGWYSRGHYTIEIPYEKIHDMLPAYIDAILAGNIDHIKH